MIVFTFITFSFLQLILLTSCKLFDLFMDVKETYRLLQTHSELRYIQNGVPNFGAISFEILLPSNARSDMFKLSWYAKSSIPLFYVINVTTADNDIITDPVIDVSSNGTISTKKSDMRFYFDCLGKGGIAKIRTNFVISSTELSKPMDFIITRKKRCPEFSSPYRSHVSYEEQNLNNTVPKTENYQSSVHVFYIGVACACASILLIAAVVAIIYIRSKRSSSKFTPQIENPDSQQQALITREIMQQMLSSDRRSLSQCNEVNGTVGRTPASSVVGPSIQELRRLYYHQIDFNPSDVRDVLHDISMPADQITLGDLVMEGTFGRIFNGTTKVETESGEIFDQPVYIKTVIEGAHQEQIDSMLFHGSLLKDWHYEHLNPITGACISPENGQPMLIYPHATHGNMKNFLQKSKISDVAAHHTLNTHQVVYMAMQIIRGVQYLHRRKFIHRDLATRNCVVTGALIVRVTDAALSRDLFPNDYHCLGDNENRPIKWLSLEALVDHKFSSSSDVWSFGVVLWELMTLAQQPYADIDPFEMADYLREGYRMSQPGNCPDDLFSMMAHCWAIAPEERPRFSQLLSFLQAFYTALGKYI